MKMKCLTKRQCTVIMCYVGGLGKMVLLYNTKFDLFR